MDIHCAGRDSWRRPQHAPTCCSVCRRLLATWYINRFFVLSVDTDSSLLSLDWTGTLEEGEIIFIPAQEVVDPDTGLTSTAIVGEVVVCN